MRERAAGATGILPVPLALGRCLGDVRWEEPYVLLEI
jgi:hypothetical protein